ncbi:unnamed protein product, partial [Prunus brigantina]
MVHRIDSYFMEHEFQRCPYEHTLYVKNNQQGDVVIVRPYVDDLIITGNNMRLLQKVGAGKLVNPTFFKQLVGSLRYLTATRPDITFGVGLISRFMEAPRQLHMQAAKRILRYVKGTQSDGIFYSANCPVKLVGYTDSDWAVVALSSTEAEYIAATNSATQAVWLRQLLGALHHEQKSPTTIYCDNNSAIALARNPVFHGRTKHIHVKFHYIRDLVNDKVVEVQYCPTGEQIADIFTKGLKID